MKNKHKNPIITSLGTKRWLNKLGQVHRDENDLPAEEHYNGSNSWFKNGFLHRGNGLPAIIYSDGTKHWYVMGACYRFDEWICEKIYAM